MEMLFTVRCMWHPHFQKEGTLVDILQVDGVVQLSSLEVEEADLD